MTLIRWSPIRRSSSDLATIHDEVGRLIGDVFEQPWTGARPVAFTPPADIEETQDAYVVRFDVPGVAQSDVKVTLSGDMLTVRGERRFETRAENATLLRGERLAGAFERSFRLEGRVRADQVTASLRDGVLVVSVPKADEARVREIEVQRG